MSILGLFIKILISSLIAYFVGRITYVVLSILLGEFGELISLWFSLITLMSTFLLLCNKIKYIKSAFLTVSIVYWSIMYVLLALTDVRLVYIGLTLIISLIIIKFRLHDVIINTLFKGKVKIVRIKETGVFNKLMSKRPSEYAPSERTLETLSESEVKTHEINFNVKRRLIEELEEREAKVLLELINSNGLSKIELSRRTSISYKRVRKIVEQLFAKNLVTVEKKRVYHKRGSYLVHVVKPVEWLNNDNFAKILEEKVRRAQLE